MAVSQRAAQLTATGESTELLMSILNNLWDEKTNPDGYVSLGIAENSLMHDVLLEHMHRNMTISSLDLTYGDGFKRLKKATARFLNRQFKPNTPIEPSHVFVSNGCTSAIQNLSWAMADPGDAFLLGRPYYGAFPPDVCRRTGTEVTPVSFDELDPMGLEAVRKYEDAIVKAQDRGQRVAAIILAHPHNPLGRCYSREVLVAFMKLCQKYQVHLISDEIYALSVFENRVDKDVPPVPFQSILSIDPAGIVDPALIHVLWGMSKDFGANGIRMGVTVSQHSAAMSDALGSVFEFSWTSSLSDIVTANALEDDAWVDKYIQDNQRKLSESHEKVLRWARKMGIEYTKGSNAGFFVWVNLGQAYEKHHPNEDIKNLDQTVNDALLAKKIFLADGVRFGAEQPGWFRIVFTQETAYLELGLRRIADAVKGAGCGVANGVVEQMA